mmetsp:Transcript_140559/g.199252  ORF Transcript_140559/g.199252 Transcript_140559/m.199252 type:complete len:132 (-) Transcript_140559:41-436(-)
MDAVGLPVTRQHGSSLKTGPRGLLHETLPKHPVEQIQLQKQQQERMKREGLANVFGQHMPMRLAYEEAVLARPLRLPALHSERVALEIVSDNDTSLGFEDTLNDPRTAIEAVDSHEVMERRLGIHIDTLEM